MSATIGDRTYSPKEIEWARSRPRQYRPPAPAPGMRVLYRTNDFFTALHSGVIVEVEFSLADRNCLFVDPWPPVIIDLDRPPAGHPRRIRTWESRLEGSAGWMPLDWAKWPRPIHDNGILKIG